MNEIEQLESSIEIKSKDIKEMRAVLSEMRKELASRKKALAESERRYVEEKIVSDFGEGWRKGAHLGYRKIFIFENPQITTKKIAKKFSVSIARIRQERRWMRTRGQLYKDGCKLLIEKKISANLTAISNKVRLITRHRTESGT